MLNKICEHNLYSAFSHTFPDLNFDGKEIKLLNEEEITYENICDHFELEVIDFYQYFGASISREENREKRILTLKTKRPNFYAFTPSEL